MLIYNPIYNKKPSGAVTNKDSVKFDVFIKENFYFNDFRIIIKNEFTGEYKSGSLKFIEKTDNDYLKYSIELDPFDIGLYYYHFEVHFDSFTAYLKNNNLILSGYLIVKSDFRVENDGIIHILGNNITLNSSFLSYMIGNSKGVYFYQPHNISIINGMLISDIKAFNAYTTKVFYN